MKRNNLLQFPSTLCLIRSDRFLEVNLTKFDLNLCFSLMLVGAILFRKTASTIISFSVNNFNFYTYLAVIGPPYCLQDFNASIIYWVVFSILLSISFPSAQLLFIPYYINLSRIIFLSPLHLNCSSVPLCTPCSWRLCVWKDD